MKRYLFAVCFVLAIRFAAAEEAPDDLLATYQKNFIRAALADKAEALADAVTDDEAPRFAAPLYEFALDYAVRYAALFAGDGDMLDVVAGAASGLKSFGRPESAAVLWAAFKSYGDPLSRTAVLEALGTCGGGNAAVVDGIEEYVSTETSDVRTLEAAVRTLALLRDTGSFPSLFRVITSSLPEQVKTAAKAAAEGLPDVKTPILDIIKNNPPADKLAALRFALDDDNLDDHTRGEIAEAALSAGLGLPGSADADQLRYEAAAALTALKRQSASPLAIRHFYRVQLDYQNGRAPRERFIEAIDCLGAMGSGEAAQALVLQLGYFNAQEERGGAVDETSVIALIRALGSIGDKAAFDYLLYVSYLTYPETIQLAAKEALAKLQW